MKNLPVLAAALAVVSTACAPAMAQNQVAAGPPSALSYSPEPTLRGPTPEVPQDDLRPLAPELAAILSPTFALHDWGVPAGPPALACPSGASPVKKVTDRGWEVSCMRGQDRHGPHRSFDRAALREVRATYESGRLHGTHVEIELRPAMQLAAMAPLDSMAAAQRALAAGWPLVQPPEPVCPTGTQLVRGEDESGCRLPGGIQHGVSVSRRPGTLTWTTFRAGEAGAGLSLTDQRTARESVYEHGTLRRVLEHDLSGPSLLEAHRGDETAILVLAARERALSRSKNGKLHGVQTRWDEAWRVIEKRSYRQGVEHAGASFSGGELRTVWRLDGRTKIEDVPGGAGAHRCEEVAQQKRLCETIDAGRVRYREVYAEGRLRAWVKLSASGARVAEGRMNDAGAEIERTEWREDGRMESRRACDERQCTDERWDASGRRTASVSKNGAPAPEPAVRTTAALNAIRDLVGR